METLKQVLEMANKAFNEHAQKKPDIFNERVRDRYIINCLESAYKHLYKESKGLTIKKL